MVAYSCTDKNQQSKKKVQTKDLEQANLKSDDANFVSKDSIFHIVNLKNLSIDENGNFEIKNQTYSTSQVKGLRLGDERKTEYEKGEFPMGIFQFPNLEYLWIGMRGFEEIPSQIENLQRLTEIDLQHGNLKKLPKEIIKLENLNRITLLWSNIKELPIGFHKMKNLKHLHLGCTQFETIPKELFRMKNLETLILSHDDECQEKREVFVETEITELRNKLANTKLMIGRKKPTSNM